MKVHTDTDLDVSPEVQRVLQFKYDHLRRAGYTTKAANTIALREDIDWHQANELLEKCGQEQALKILL